MFFSVHTRTINLSLYAAVAVLLLLATVGNATNLYDLRIGDHATKTRVVVDVTDNPQQKINRRSNPDRVVLDIKGQWQGKPIRLPAKSGLIEKIESGSQPNGDYRIVLHTSTPAAVKKYFYLPPDQAAGKQHGRLVFDISSTSSPIADDTITYQRDSAALARLVEGNGQVPLPPGQSPKNVAALEDVISVTDMRPTIQVTTPPAPELPPEPVTKSKPERSYHKPVVVIDAGHGGKDPGAIGVNGTREKDVVLKMSRELKNALQATGRYQVHLTRDDDRFIPLHGRVNIARNRKADLFISVHADSLAKPNTSVQGSTIYTLSEVASDKEAARAAARENKSDMIGGVDLTTENYEVSSILIDLVQRETMNLSAKFANMAIDSLSSRINVKSKAHRFAGFAVLKGVDTPSILLEIGYLSNKNEEQLLNQPGYRAKLAAGLVESINTFFTQQVALNSVH